MSPILAHSVHALLHRTCHGLLRNFAFAVAVGCKADMAYCSAYVGF